MCGIVGYVGSKFGRKIVIDGLSQLEYRGYDSAGFVCVNYVNNKLSHAKVAGKLVDLENSLFENSMNGFVAMGHTRWATHGVVTADNAHPHFDCSSTIAIVHNGIIENYHALSQQLIASGHCLRSQTDSELIAHLFEDEINNTDKLSVAMVTHVLRKLCGSYAIVMLVEAYADSIIAIRKGSPLCIGIADDGYYIASDILAFSCFARKVIFLPEQTFAFITQYKCHIYDFDGNLIDVPIVDVDVKWSVIDKQSFKHYMLKEIYEQKQSIIDSVQLYRSLGNNVKEIMGLSLQEIKDLKSVLFIGCGTSLHAGYMGELFMESISHIVARSFHASEFSLRYFNNNNELKIAISQSGETADTLESVRLLKKNNNKVVAITNVASSSLVRESDGFLLTQAGPEVSVASTKAFTTQLTALYWFAHYIAFAKQYISHTQLYEAEEKLIYSAGLLEQNLDLYKNDIINRLAPLYAKYNSMIFVGRHIGYFLAKEAALKLKEIAYVFAQAYPAGELKHGPLALVDENVPIVVFSDPNPIIYKKLLSSVQEIKARKGNVLVFAYEGQHEVCELADNYFLLPLVDPLLGPLALSGLVQFFVYQIACERGCNIDMPRNLAKSVTVE